MKYKSSNISLGNYDCLIW